MRFSVKVAPGVRVSASSRGLRTTVGSKAARVHVGGGPTAVSGSIGPVNYRAAAPRAAAGLGGQRQSAPGPRSATAAIGQQLASVSKVEQAAAIQQVLDRIAHLHEETFSPAARRSAAPAAVEQQEAILRDQLRKHRDGVSSFNLKKQREARQAAAWAAYRQIDQLYQADRQRQTVEQQQLDDWWARLCANDPATVLTELAAAFADNEAPAAPIDVAGDTVSLVVQLPPLSSLPERQPSVTAAGNLSLRKMTKAQAAAHYKQLAAGFILVTVKEAFAVAPGIQQARVVAVRACSPATTGDAQPECIVAASLPRQQLAQVPWRQTDAGSILLASASDTRVNPKGVAEAWEPLRLDNEPEIAAVLRAVQLTPSATRTD